MNPRGGGRLYYSVWALLSGGVRSPGWEWAAAHPHSASPASHCLWTVVGKACRRSGLQLSPLLSVLYPAGNEEAGTKPEDSVTSAWCMVDSLCWLLQWRWENKWTETSQVGQHVTWWVNLLLPRSGGTSIPRSPGVGNDLAQSNTCQCCLWSVWSF